MHLLCVVGMLLQAQTPVDTAGVYEAVLRDVRNAHPSAQVALSVTRWGNDAREAPCGGGGPQRRHSAAVLQRLRASGVIDTVCVVPDDHVNCPDQAGKVFVALGGVRDEPPRGAGRGPDGVWVLATVIPPCGGECRMPEISTTRYLLQRDANGAWRVVAKRPESVA